MRFADTSRGRPFAKDPAVAWFGGRYWLYYTLPPHGDGRPGDGYAIGIAASDDLDRWRKVGELLPAPDAPYEANGLCAPAVLVRGDTLHLFYQTYGNGPRDAICHATTTDGLHFERDATNPVFAPTGAWNNGRAIDADVIVRGDTAFLSYATRDPTGRVQMLGVATADAGSDCGGGAWTQRGNGPILRPVLPWEQECIEAPAMCVRDGRLFMFYAGAYNNRPQQIGVAASDDGLTWSRLADTPFLPNGPAGAWNASESGHPYLFTDRDGTAHLFFQGNADDGKTWYLARAVVGWRDGVPHLARMEDAPPTDD